MSVSNTVAKEVTANLTPFSLLTNIISLQNKISLFWKVIEMLPWIFFLLLLGQMEMEMQKL